MMNPQEGKKDRKVWIYSIYELKRFDIEVLFFHAYSSLSMLLYNYDSTGYKIKGCLIALIFKKRKNYSDELKEKKIKGGVSFVLQ